MRELVVLVRLIYNGFYCIFGIPFKYLNSVLHFNYIFKKNVLFLRLCEFYCMTNNSHVSIYIVQAYI